VGELGVLLVALRVVEPQQEALAALAVDVEHREHRLLAHAEDEPSRAQLWGNLHTDDLSELPECGREALLQGEHRVNNNTATNGNKQPQPTTETAHSTNTKTRCTRTSQQRSSGRLAATTAREGEAWAGQGSLSAMSVGEWCLTAVAIEGGSEKWPTRSRK
jgi:hypothetical protein